MCQKDNQFLLREYILRQERALGSMPSGLFNIYLFERADGMRNPLGLVQEEFLAHRAPLIQFWNFKRKHGTAGWDTDSLAHA